MQNKFSHLEIVQLITETFNIANHFNLKLYSASYDGLKNRLVSVRWLKDEEDYIIRKSLNLKTEDILLPPNARNNNFCIYSHAESFVDEPIYQIVISFKADSGKIIGEFSFVADVLDDDDLFSSPSFWVCAKNERLTDQDRISWLLDATEVDDIKKFIVSRIMPATINRPEWR